MPAASVVALIADGMTLDEITTEDPDLTRKDIETALRYAAETGS